MKIFKIFKPIENDNLTYHYWIDIFRFFAAFSVFIYHYPHFYHIGILNENLFKVNLSLNQLPFYDFFKYLYLYGNRGVDLFWVISGFIFSAVYFNKKVSASQFWISRFARLYPLHFITLLFISLLQFISFRAYNQFQIVEYNDFYHFLLNLFFISSWGFELGRNFNWPIWSVSIELIIYFIFFFSMSRLFSRGILKPLILITFFSIAYFFNTQIELLNSSIMMCGFYFFSGSLIYYIRTWMIYNKFEKMIPYLSLLFFILGFFTFGKILNNHDIYVFPSLVLLISFLDISFKSMGKKFSYVGNLCYSLYLWHMPLQILIMTFYLNRLDLSERYSLLNSKFFILSFFIATILVSFYSYEKLEKPLRKIINRSFN